MAAKPGQIALRRFDHDEAIRRYAAGETQTALAREYGVSQTAIGRVVSPKVRARMQANSSKRLLDLRTACLGGCGRLVWTHGTKGRSGYCITCSNKSRYVEQHGTQTGYATQGCRCEACTKAAADARRARRHATRQSCSHGCGTLVDTQSRRDKEKPLECRSCALKRIHAEQKRRAGQP